MSIASKYNKTAPKFTFKFDGTPTFASLKEVFVEGKENTYILRGLYISDKGKFGPAPVAITDKVFFNLPKHLTPTVEEMLNDEEFIAATNAGKVGFAIYPYDKDGKTCYGVEWIDIDSVTQ